MTPDSLAHDPTVSRPMPADPMATGPITPVDMSSHLSDASRAALPMYGALARPHPVGMRTEANSWLHGLAAAAAVAILLVVGILVAGRLAGNQLVAIVLTTAWFGLVAGAVILLRHRRPLLIGAASAYAVVGLVAGLVLGVPLVTDSTVNEDVPDVALMSATGDGATTDDVPPAKDPGPVALSAGAFRSVEHAGKGQATLVRQADGSHRVVLTNFATDNGPDLRVHLVGAQGKDRLDLGRLKGNKGNQQYVVPSGADLADYSAVEIWCRAFSVTFTRATLA